MVVHIPCIAASIACTNHEPGCFVVAPVELVTVVVVVVVLDLLLVEVLQVLARGRRVRRIVRSKLRWSRIAKIFQLDYVSRCIVCGTCCFVICTRSLAMQCHAEVSACMTAGQLSHVMYSIYVYMQCVTICA
jgi:hypothetical protein